jgi:uncharacterized membrane protein YadS
MQKKQAKKKIRIDEYSKMLALMVFAVGVSLLVVYCVALLTDRSPSDAILYVSASLICGVDAFYSTYQAVLKNSRNKYKVSIDGEDFLEE